MFKTKHLNLFLLCVSVCGCECVSVCVCVFAGTANYPSYKYKSPILHWVSGWLQCRHNWFQMVTQIFQCCRACVREKAAGERESWRKRGRKGWVTAVDKYRVSAGINKETLNVSFDLRFYPLWKLLTFIFFLKWELRRFVHYTFRIKKIAVIL